MKRANNTSAVAMDYNLAQLLKNPTGSARELTLSADLRGLDPLLDPVEPFAARIKVIRTKNGVLVSLTGHTSLRVTCSRCLEPVIIPVEQNFEEEFLQTVDIITGVSLGTSQDDPALLIDEHHDIHLADLIREYLLTALPMHPLCREDCKGLCPQCGHNLNQGPCGHENQTVDERWAALKALLDK